MLVSLQNPHMVIFVDCSAFQSGAEVSQLHCATIVIIYVLCVGCNSPGSDSLVSELAYSILIVSQRESGAGRKRCSRICRIQGLLCSECESLLRTHYALVGLVCFVQCCSRVGCAVMYVRGDIFAM